MPFLEKIDTKKFLKLDTVGEFKRLDSELFAFEMR